MDHKECVLICISAVSESFIDFTTSILTSFSSFVAIFCDMAPANRQSQKATMAHVAEQIGMPATFVALRNRIAHHELVSLQVLEKETRAAIDWLRVNHWDKYANVTPPQKAETLQKYTTEEIKQQLKEILRNYRQQRRVEVTTQSFALEASLVAEEAVTVLDMSTENCLPLLVDMFVDKRMLIPSGRT